MELTASTQQGERSREPRRHPMEPRPSELRPESGLGLGRGQGREPTAPLAPSAASGGASGGAAAAPESTRLRPRFQSVECRNAADRSVSVSADNSAPVGNSAPVERVRESGSAKLLASEREETREDGPWSGVGAGAESQAGDGSSARAEAGTGAGAGELRLLRTLRSRRARRRARVLGAEALEVEDLLCLLGLEERARPEWDGALASLARLAPDELSARLGARVSQAWRLSAAFELGRRAAVERSLERPVVRGPADVLRLLGDLVRGEEREQFHVLLLDGKHRLKARHTVSVGSLSTSIVHPREVFRPAVRAAAAAVLCAHNHPSGDPEPSPEDVAVTQRLDQAGKLLGIPLLDHVVLGDGAWVSMRQRLGL